MLKYIAILSGVLFDFFDRWIVILVHVHRVFRGMHDRGGWLIAILYYLQYTLIVIVDIDLNQLIIIEKVEIEDKIVN